MEKSKKAFVIFSKETALRWVEASLTLSWGENVRMVSAKEDNQQLKHAGDPF